MMISKENIYKLMDQFKIVYKGEELSYNQFLDLYLEFLTSCIKTENMRCMILHPGTDLFTILGLIMFTLTNLYEDMLNTDDVVKSLNCGDKVIITEAKEQLAIFRGMEYVESFKKKMAVFEMRDGRKYLPPTSYYKITPYYGNAKALGGRGMGKNLALKKRFYSYIMSEEEQRVNPELHCSSVIVCEKVVADSLMNDIKIIFNREKPVRLCELFAGAYYTQNDMVSYAGNSYGFEPILKFTSRMSVARELILEDRDNDIKNLFVCDNTYFSKTVSELTNLLERDTLNNVVLLGEINGLPGYEILNRYADLKLFASTPHVLKAYENSELSNGIMGTLNKRIKAIVNNKISSVFCMCAIDENKYDLIKIKLSNLSQIDEPEMKRFIVTTYSLLKLFTLSIFPLSHVDKVSNIEGWENINLINRMSYVNTYSEKYTGEKQKDIKEISAFIEEFYNVLYYENNKFQYIFDYIISEDNQQKILIIVPKAYFKEIFNFSFQGKNRRYLKNVEIKTAASVKKENTENRTVIICGGFADRELIFLQSMPAFEMKMLIYEFERKFINRLNLHTERLYEFYDMRNNIPSITQSTFCTDMHHDTVEDMEGVLDEFIIKYEVAAMSSLATRLSSDTSNNLVEIYKIVNFASGETAFLTKYFGVYVLKREDGQIEEKSVSELVEGEELIFAKRNSQSRDIVDVLLQKIILSDGCPEGLSKAYERSIYWKTVLKQYMSEKDLTFRQLSSRMNKFGKSKHEVTLRTWLNEDTHIVGPRDEESFYEIALLTEDRIMLESPEVFCNACNEIRSMRVRILKYVGKYAFNKVGRRGKKIDYLLNDIIGDASDVVEVYQITHIMDGLDEKGNTISIPSHFTNKPQVRS